MSAFLYFQPSVRLFVKSSMDRLPWLFAGATQAVSLSSLSTAKQNYCSIKSRVIGRQIHPRKKVYAHVQLENCLIQSKSNHDGSSTSLELSRLFPVALFATEEKILREIGTRFDCSSHRLYVRHVGRTRGATARHHLIRISPRLTTFLVAALA